MLRLRFLAHVLLVAVLPEKVHDDGSQAQGGRDYAHENGGVISVGDEHAYGAYSTPHDAEIAQPGVHVGLDEEVSADERQEKRQDSHADRLLVHIFLVISRNRGLTSTYTLMRCRVTRHLFLVKLIVPAFRAEFRIVGFSETAVRALLQNNPSNQKAET